MPCMPVLKITLTSEPALHAPYSVQVLFVYLLCLIDVFVSSLRLLKWKRFEDVLGLQAGCRAVSAGLDTAASAGLPAVAPQPTRTAAVFLEDSTVSVS